MKKIKIIVPVVSCLLATTLFSCANKGEQPESDYYSISIANAHKSPKVTIEGSNLIKKGNDCDVLIRFEPFTYCDFIPGYEPIGGVGGKKIRVCQANRIGYDIALDENCYTFEEVEGQDHCLYKLHIGKEYMTTSYVVDINSKFVEAYGGEGEIDFAEGSKLNSSNAEITVVNTSVGSDLTFFVTPKNFQSGYTFDGVTQDAVEIKGINDTYPEGYPLTLSRNELVLCDSPIQGLGHYQTLTKQLRIALPMEQLFEVDSSDPIYGYKQKFDSIQISSTEGVAYNNKENLFYPTADETSCTFESGKINLEADGVHYTAKFTPKSGYTFPTTFTVDNFPITDLTILPNIYVPTGHPYFRAFEVHTDPSKQGVIKAKPYNAYYGNERLSIVLPDTSPYVLEDTIGNIYVPMGYDGSHTGNNYWLDVKVESDNSLTIDVNIIDMIKYIEFPTSTIINRFDLSEYKEDEFYKFYRDGSIDFIQSFNFTVKATHN